MKSLLVMGIGALTLIHAQAAPIELAASTEGSGTVEIGGSGDHVSKANLVLKRDGKFTLGFVGGEDTRFSGSWRPAEGDNVSLRLTEADGRDARGSGHIDLTSRSGRFELNRISVWGETDRGRSVNARFTARRVIVVPAPPPPRPRVFLDSERSGLGRLEVAGRNTYRITRAHVQLLSDGRAHVHTEGNVALRYEGTWRRSGESTVTLNVRGGLDREHMRGLVHHRGGRFVRLELSGTNNRRYHTLEFAPLR